ncbi:bifunctional tetrahydrofolate synthase/dihydrofolate synthase [Candidatus Riesia pediculischaeffi]|uniref:Dihydrofolate synthase/folylpolyglutamate synthase n=1 Tax=Candidatus Riesia pediculischaeffi TaxID=428411 RepID=A0A1V0HK24_9ENTR|nr:bifunctional tetrahydrofolate synthase/dihydrofolate synthase [Candidatus Riesia pediculischaeffi]ARC53168.1 hypothetical protein AOQ87_00415 [Candidatus Riesia pediculischaeffi]
MDIKNFSLDHWISYIRCQHINKIDMSLDRIRKVADDMKLLRPAPFVIIVSGTNGKGTTCNVIENILICSGLKVGVYSSPHLISYTERIRIFGKDISSEELCKAFYDVEKNRGENITLTEFEYSTLAALKIFKSSHLDIVVLEVGCGGRLDATNIIDADISVIVNISIDHNILLGNDREQVGYQKCGIFRSGQTAVIGEDNVPSSIRIEARRLTTHLFIYRKNWIFDSDETGWKWKSEKYIVRNLPISTSIPMINVASGLAAIYVSKKNCVKIRRKIKDEHIRNGISLSRLPGRFQVIGSEKEGPLIILDVAHNAHAARCLSKKLDHIQYCGKRIYAIVSILSDKDIEKILSELKDKIYQWNFVSNIQDERGLSSKELSKYMIDSIEYENFLNAYESVIKDVGRNILLIFGSFYIVSEYLKIFGRE